MKYKIEKMILTLWLVLTSTAALAEVGQVWVQGQSNRYDQHGAGVSTTRSIFQVTYQNKNLSWGSKVFLVWGYRNFKGSWATHSYPNEMNSVEAYSWQQQVTVTGDKYTGPLSNFEYVFLVKLPDGQSYYDNGGKASLGFYSTPVPNSFQGWQALPVWVMGSAADYK